VNEIQAAGVVVHDHRGRIAAVHRPRRGDWSLPKGKLEPAEGHHAAALRECHEETGLRVRLEAPLPEQAYQVNGGSKLVRYWRAAVVGDDGFLPNREVDRVRWVKPAEVGEVLSYESDVELVETSIRTGPTTALAVLRHAPAVKRAIWAAGETTLAARDSARPLTADGLLVADAVAELLHAFGVERVVTSPSRRCRQTIEPYAARVGIAIELEPLLSEEGAKPNATASLSRRLARRGGRVVMCTHRPVLPLVLAGAAHGGEAPGASIPAGAMIVLHRTGDGTVAAVEHIRP
jgi:8-oxo-dGTP diphosphatase